MRLLTTAVVTLSAVAVLYAAPADACTNPESGAGDPTVTGRPSRDPNPSATPGSGTPIVEEGKPGGAPAPAPAAEPGGSGGTATPNSGEVALDSAFIEVAWTPGAEKDGDPNNNAFYSHDGHRISTRVQVKDATTQQVVMEESVDQYNYGGAVKGVTHPAVTRMTAKLQPGHYEVRVQSVFSRHDEIRYGIEGKWQRVGAVSQAPAIGASVPAAKIYIPAGVDQGGLVAAEGGCSATGGALGGLWLVVLLLSARKKKA